VYPGYHWVFKKDTSELGSTRLMILSQICIYYYKNVCVLQSMSRYIHLIQYKIIHEISKQKIIEKIQFIEIFLPIKSPSRKFFLFIFLYQQINEKNSFNILPAAPTHSIHNMHIHPSQILLLFIWFLHSYLIHNIVGILHIKIFAYSLVYVS